LDQCFGKYIDTELRVGIELVQMGDANLMTGTYMFEMGTSNFTPGSMTEYLYIGHIKKPP
jgi:hypothetical protein